MTDRVFAAETALRGHAGRFEIPDGPVRGWAIFAHRSTPGEPSFVPDRIAGELARCGIGSFCLDLRGKDFCAGEDIRAIIAAAEAMASAGVEPSLLIGHGGGATAILLARARIAGIAAVATIGAPADPAGPVRCFAAGAGEWTAPGEPPHALSRPDMKQVVATLDAALLLLHAPGDAVIGIANAARLFGDARHPKSFVSLDGADHLLRSAEDARFAGGVIAGWAGRYLPAMPVPTPRPGAVARETGRGRFQLAIDARAARFLADEPELFGGLDSGATPFDLLCAALAACTTMTLRLYLAGKAWPVRALRTRVVHRRDAEGRNHFRCDIDWDGEADAAQRARLIEIAGRCPVHRVLAAGADVTVRAIAPQVEPALANAD